MLNFNRLQQNKVYRVKNTFSLPYDRKHPQRGYLLTVFSEDIDMTAKFFANQYISFRRYDRYYVEKRFKEEFAGMRVREVNKQKDIFDNGFGKYFPKEKLILRPEMAKDYNVIYEIGQFNEKLNTNKRVEAKSIMKQSEIKFNEVFDRLIAIRKDFPNHKKVLFIPVDAYIDDPKSPSIWTKRSYLYNFAMLFIRKIDSDYLKFKNELSEWTIVFINHNELFYMNCSDMNEDTSKTIRKLFRKFKSSKYFVDTSGECDDDNLTDDEEDNDEIIEQENSMIVEKYKSDVRTALVLGEVPKDESEKIIHDIEAITKLETEKTVLPRVSVQKAEIEKDQSRPELSNTILTQKPKVIQEIDKEPNVKSIDKTKLDNEVKETITKTLSAQTLQSKSVTRLAREKKIKEEMKNIKIDEKTSISDLIKKAQQKKIDDNIIKSSLSNPKFKNIKFNNFEKGYNEKLLDYDMMNILTSFAEKDRPLYLIKFDKEDTSTATDKKYTISCVYEDEFGRRHNLTFDWPKFVNNKFIFLNGSEKIFLNQIIPLPVTKVSPDQVQISSAYNKIFLTRFGTNSSNSTSKFFKMLGDIPKDVMEYERGNNIEINTEFATSMEYDELSKKFNKVFLKKSNTTIYFNQKEIREICDAEELKFDDESELPFAIEENENGIKSLICVDIETGNIKHKFDNDTDEDDVIENGITPIDFIIENLDDDSKIKFSATGASKRNMYTRAKIMAKDVPIVILLAFLDGLEPLLRRIKCTYEFTETRKKINNSKQTMVQFKDGYLIYSNYPQSNALILNGLYAVPTEDYNFLDFSTKDIYYEIFTKLFGRRNIGNAFENFQQLFVDSITKEILEDFNLPTDFLDVVIYANSLLENNLFDKDGDMKNYRVRSNEMMNAHLYKILSKAYESYRLSADNKSPNKFSVKKNAVINDMFDSQVMEEYSNINPIYEIDRMRSTSFKGPGGCNLDRGFKIEKRAYNESMLGLLAQSSPVSSNVGISRIMSLNPNVISLRGYIEPGTKDVSNQDGTTMLSGAELLVPMSATHDDPQRVAMASTQSRHTIATMDSDIPLFGYGMDKILSKVISDKFAFKAKENGVIQEYNPKLGYLMVKYDSGRSDVVDLTDKQELNTGSGFYIDNKLDAIFTEVGKRFSKDDVLAANSQFFQYDELTGDTIYKSGPLARVAVMHGSFVYEDSTLVTEAFASRMDSYVDEVKEIRLGKNSNVYDIRVKGDQVRVNDPFIIFDESYNDEYLNKVLEKMNEKDRQEFIESSRTNIRSKWNGEIIDVKIYYTCPKTEISESLRKAIVNYEKDIHEREKNFESSGIDMRDMISLNDKTEPTIPENGKIAGVKMDEFDVLIKFFVRTVDKYSIGDKLSFSTALKGINQSMIERGKEPFLVSDPSIKIDAFLSLIGIYSRMTNSATITMALNTVLIGAEKKIKDILENKI